jgi:hypothetical protein
MPKFMVIGNCQANGLARLISYFTGGETCEFVPNWKVVERWGDLERCLTALRQYDCVFVQPFKHSVIGYDSLRRELPGIVPWPLIYFTAFHPDMVTVFDKRNGKSLGSPTGDWHSALALYGFLAGMDEPAIARLFNGKTYERLGYLDDWQPSVRSLHQEFQSIGYSLTDAIPGWVRNGPFMYGINHPKTRVLAEVARQALMKAGINIRFSDSENFVFDDLGSGPIWSVYPEVAERYSLPGSYMFKRESWVDVNNTPEFMTLERFIAESVRIYRSLPKEALNCERIARWKSQSVVID